MPWWARPRSKGPTARSRHSRRAWRASGSPPRGSRRPSASCSAITKLRTSIESRSSCSRKATSGLRRAEVGLRGDLARALGAPSPRISSRVIAAPAPAAGGRRPRGRAPPRWPSLTRWSADSVAVISGPRDDLSVDRPGPFHDLAEADDGDLRRIDDAEDGLDALLAEARDGDRGIGQLGAAQPPLRARWTRSRKLRISSPSALPVGVVQRGRDQAAPPQRDRHADVDRRRSGRPRLPRQTAFSSGTSRRAQRHGLEQQDAVEQPLGRPAASGSPRPARSIARCMSIVVLR